MKRPSRLLVVVILVLLAFYTFACGVVRHQQARFIYFPSAEITVTPQEYGAHFRDVQIPLGNSQSLHGWWIPADGQARTLLYLHGNGGNISANARHAVRFRELGLNVLIIDYRGYGRSRGDFPTEKRVYEDAEAAWAYLTGELKIAPGNIILYGHSLGGAVAIEMARRHPEAAALITESTFTSVADMAKNGPFRMLPIGSILSERYDSLGKIEEVRMPKLILHGRADTVVPFRMAERLLEKAPEPKRLVGIASAGHENTATVGGAHWRDAVRSFLSGLPAAPR